MGMEWPGFKPKKVIGDVAKLATAISLAGSLAGEAKAEEFFKEPDLGRSNFNGAEFIQKIPAMPKKDHIKHESEEFKPVEVKSIVNDEEGKVQNQNDFIEEDKDGNVRSRLIGGQR